MGSSTGSLLVEDDDGVRNILKVIRRRASFHSEDEYRLNERKGLRVEGDPRSHPVWRDEVTALRCTERLVAPRARDRQARARAAHHHRAGNGVPRRPQGRRLGRGRPRITSRSTAPDCYERLGGFAQMNPPVRDASHREAIWRALDQGVVDVLGSDHAPHTREEKAKPYPASPSGMTGVQTLVPIMLDHVNAGRLTLARLVDLTSAGPARLFGIARKGRIAVGLRRRSHRGRSQAA